MPHYSSKRLFIALGLGLSCAACAASADDDGAGESAAGVNAQAVEGSSSTSATAPEVDIQATKGGASAYAGKVDVTTAQQALSELTGDVDVSVDSFKSGLSAAAAPPSSAATQGGYAAPNRSIDVPCAAGGTAGVEGYANPASDPVAVDVKVAIAFRSCVTRSGTMLDGNLEFSQSVANGPEAPLQIETLYQGDVNLSGEVNVSCPVDLNVLVDATGRALKVEGTFCNQDASDLNMQVAPRWASE